MIKNILFDLDGTLTESGLGITSSVQYALQKAGVEAPSLQELEKFIGPPLHQSFETFYGFNQAQTIQAIADYREYFNEKGIYQNKLYPGVSEMLASLKENGHTLFVSTSKPEVYAKIILENFHLAAFFNDIVGSPLSDKGSSKTDIIENTLKNNALQPSDSIMIGDREHDIFGAHQNGLKAIGVLYGYGDKPELEAVKADYIVEDTAQLTSLLLSL